MGNEYGIHNAHTFGRMEPHLKADYREAQLILPIDNGDVLIEWRSDDPGRALMNRELPLIIILMLSTIAFTWLMRPGALIKAQINDENVFLLEQSRQALTASERRFRDVIEATTDWIWHCCKVSDEAAFCLIQRPYISKTLLTRRISPRGSP